MKKLFLPILLLAFFAFVTYSQPPPPGGNSGNNNSGGNGDDNKNTPPAPQGDQMQVSSLAIKPPMDWYCNIEFYYKGNPYYYEELSYGDTEAYRGSLGKKVDNKISEIYWNGDRCYCWVILYQSKYFKGLNLGLWIDSESGSYDLSKYITYDFSDKGWETWDSTVSSYSIYCY